MMMKWLVSFSIVLLVSFACKKNKPDDGCISEKFEYNFSNNKQVDTTHHISNVIFASVVNGNDIVFTYRYTSRTCPGIADDGYMDLLIFQVPAGSTSFNYTTAADLQNNKCYFMRSCFCANVSSRIVSGMIKGTRIGNNRWTIQADVLEPVTNVRASFNKQFELQ